MSTSRQEVAGGLAGGAAGVDPEAAGSGEAAAVAASRCWLALRFLPADFGAPVAAGTCGAEAVVLAEGEGSALAASKGSSRGYQRYHATFGFGDAAATG